MRIPVHLIEVAPSTGVDRLPLCLDQHLGGIPPRGGRLHLHAGVNQLAIKQL